MNNASVLQLYSANGNPPAADPALDRRQPLPPLLGRLRLMVGVQQGATAFRAASALPSEQEAPSVGQSRRASWRAPPQTAALGPQACRSFSAAFLPRWPSLTRIARESRITRELSSAVCSAQS